MRASLARAWVRTSAVVVAGLGGEADDQLARRPRLVDQFGAGRRGCGPAGRQSARVAEPFLSLVAGDRRRAEVGDRGGHDDDVGVGGLGEHRGPRSSSAVPTGTTRTPNGAGRSTLARDQHDVGAAGGGDPGQRPALLARGAVAEVADRVQRLAGAAGADRRPAGRSGRAASAAAPWLRARRRRPARRCRPGSGSRPGPGVRAGQPARPRAAARRRRGGAGWRRCPGSPGAATSRCAWPARTRTGQDAVSSVAVSRSSARPVAARASRSAVAGATTTRSAFWPMRTCGDLVRRRTRRRW